MTSKELRKIRTRRRLIRAVFIFAILVIAGWLLTRGIKKDLKSSNSILKPKIEEQFKKMVLEA